MSLSLLFSRLSSPSSLSHSSHNRCSRTLIILAGLNSVHPCLSWTGEPGTGHYSRSGHISSKQKGGSSSLTGQQQSSQCSPGYRQSSLPWRHSVCSGSTWCPPGSPRVFSIMLLSSHLAPSLDWWLFLHRCRTLQSTLLSFMKFLVDCWIISPARWGPSGWWHGCLVCRPHLPVLYHLQIAEGTLCPIIQVINEEVKLYWSQFWLLGWTTSDWPPAGLPAFDHNILSPAVQLVSSRHDCPLIYLVHILPVCHSGCCGRRCWKPW